VPVVRGPVSKLRPARRKTRAASRQAQSQHEVRLAARSPRLPGRDAAGNVHAISIQPLGVRRAKSEPRAQSRVTSHQRLDAAGPTTRSALVTSAKSEPPKGAGLRRLKGRDTLHSSQPLSKGGQKHREKIRPPSGNIEVASHGCK
jgi:hypothetical protein